MHPVVRGFVPRTLAPDQPVRTSRAAREREAKAYWDSMSPEQEAWVLRKMRFGQMGLARKR